MNLIESFDITQFVNGATHLKGHTLDLVLSIGLPIQNMKLFVFCMSDHKGVVFKVPLPCPMSKCSAPVRARIFNSNSVNDFTNAYVALPYAPSNKHTDIDSLSMKFNNNSTTILDSIAPFKVRTPKLIKQQWLYDHTRSLKRECRKAERSWKENQQLSSLTNLKELMVRYQSLVNLAKNIIANNCNNPRTFFNIINSVTSPPIIAEIDPSPDEFLTFSINKIDTIRLQIPPAIPDSSIPPNYPFLCNQ